MDSIYLPAHQQNQPDPGADAPKPTYGIKTISGYYATVANIPSAGLGDLLSFLHNGQPVFSGVVVKSSPKAREARVLLSKKPNQEQTPTHSLTAIRV